MKSNPLKIAILEDNRFYNDLLTRQILHYTQSLERDAPVSIEVQSYVETNTCLANFDLDTFIFFMDYYLDQGKTANTIVKRINRFALDCQIVILSQNKRSYVIDELLKNGVNDFIHKDDDTLNNICLYIDNYLRNQIKK